MWKKTLQNTNNKGNPFFNVLKALEVVKLITVSLFTLNLCNLCTRSTEILNVARSCSVFNVNNNENTCVRHEHKQCDNHDVL